MDAIAALADRLMRAVVASGVVRHGIDRDASVAVTVMREELKAFVAGPKYADERALVATGGHNLAWASLVATCIARIAREREAAAA